MKDEIEALVKEELVEEESSPVNKKAYIGTILFMTLLFPISIVTIILAKLKDSIRPYIATLFSVLYAVIIQGIIYWVFDLSMRPVTISLLILLGLSLVVMFELLFSALLKKIREMEQRAEHIEEESATP